LEIHKLQLLCERPSPDRGIFPSPMSAPERRSAPMYHADGPNGHREQLCHRDDGFGSVFTISHHPVKGASYSPPPRNSFVSEQFSPRWGPPPLSSGVAGKLPKLPFPMFDGDNPQALDVPLCRLFRSLPSRSVPLGSCFDHAFSRIRGALVAVYRVAPAFCVLASVRSHAA